MIFGGNPTDIFQILPLGKTWPQECSTPMLEECLEEVRCEVETKLQSGIKKKSRAPLGQVMPGRDPCRLKQYVKKDTGKQILTS